MRIVIVVLLAAAANLALYIHLQQDAAPYLAKVPEQQSDLIEVVVTKPY